jgi:hypothetical protein
MPETPHHPLAFTPTLPNLMMIRFRLIRGLLLIIEFAFNKHRSPVIRNVKGRFLTLAIGFRGLNLAV